MVASFCFNENVHHRPSCSVMSHNARKTWNDANFPRFLPNLLLNKKPLWISSSSNSLNFSLKYCFLDVENFNDLCHFLIFSSFLDTFSAGTLTAFKVFNHFTFSSQRREAFLSFRLRASPKFFSNHFRQAYYCGILCFYRSRKKHNHEKEVWKPNRKNEKKGIIHLPTA